MVDLSIYKKHSRLYGALCTAVITGALFLLFFIYVIHTPNPPFPENPGGGGTGTGIELNLGFTDMGSGPIQDENVLPVEETDEQKAQPAEEDKVVTQDIEDAPVIQEAKKTIKKETPKEIKKDVPKKTIKKTKVEKIEVKQTVNKNALYKPGIKSDGTTDKTGDQGRPDGNLAAKAFGNGGSGGSGGGTGGGIGTGTGTGIGSGSSYTLEGRSLEQTLPTPEYNGQEEGIVVIEITVNKEGQVTQANYKMKGSTITDNSLIESSKKAAIKAKFKRKPDAPAYQKGIIVYRFKLN
jgi:hypothetical protein